MFYCLDEEFLDTGRTIDLVSIGLVSEDGRELYRQSVEFDPRKASPWVKENVFPYLERCPWTNVQITMHDLYFHEKYGQCVDQIRGRVHNCPWRTREQLKRDIQAFMDVEAYGKPELITWCGSYDHVAFCQIFGTMMELPKGFPHHVQDIQVALDKKGITDDMLPKQEGTAHNALADAKYIKKLWEEVCQ